jgi:Metallo-peptidase family M12
MRFYFAYYFNEMHLLVNFGHYFFTLFETLKSHRSMRRVITSVLFLFLLNSMFAQKWLQVNPVNITPKGQVDFYPSVYKTYEIDDKAIKSLLWSAPHENNTSVDKSNVVISLPAADGTMLPFNIVQYDMMEKGLADQFPDVRTFYGIVKSDPSVNVRIDYTPYGFRAVIVDHENRTFIDYTSREDLDHRIVYFKKDYPKLYDFHCEFTGEDRESDHGPKHAVGSRVGDCTFRTYRLANAATGEFSAFHGGTVALSQAAIVTIINRVNQVYESDIAVRLILVANNTNIVYTNAATDPYTNNNGVTMLTENQTTCDNVANIGSANYDIGHVFSTGGGGVASLGVPCTNGSKARGVTGLSAPVGDPFAIDYVAHEVGHQFGGNHPFNSSSTANGACDPSNNNPPTSIEPGSGSTIMAYAGICAPVNIQNNSDAYFHSINLAEIQAEISTNTCDVETIIGNTKPTITAVPDYTIPISTPFVLEGIATDPENDPLTYCWEQFDIATSTTAPTATSTTQAQFRSYFPTTSPRRYFPRLPDIANNSSPIWEVLPTVSRSMNFRLTVRDYHVSAGCSNEDNVVVNTVSTAGPFVVTVLNTAPSPLVAGQNFTVTWSVANTIVAPINATKVDIFLSYDGGITYPVTLASDTPNDGSKEVVIPVTTTRGNIFFDINNANFAVIAGSPTYFLTINPTSAIRCNTQSQVITVNTQAVSGFSTPINLSTNSLPAGTSAVFSPSVVTPGQSSTLTLSNFGSNVGVYNVNVVGTNATVTRTQEFALTLISQSNIPVLNNPSNNAKNISITPTLDWSAGSGFDYQISKTPEFTTLDASGSTTTNSLTLSTPLEFASTYYWRVRVNDPCGTTDWSIVNVFTTTACFTYAATGLPLLMPVPVATGTSTITIKDKGTVSDIDVVNLQGLHIWLDDLTFTLTAPSGAS